LLISAKNGWERGTNPKKVTSFAVSMFFLHVITKSAPGNGATKAGISILNFCLQKIGEQQRPAETWSHQPNFATHKRKAGS
jgi:hypothetical protein